MSFTWFGPMGEEPRPWYFAGYVQGFWYLRCNVRYPERMTIDPDVWDAWRDAHQYLAKQYRDTCRNNRRVRR